MKDFDLKAAFNTEGLDQNNPGAWPVGIKGLALAALCAVIIIAGVYGDFGLYRPITKLSEDLQKVERQEGELKQSFEAKARLAANLEVYQNQIKEMEDSFGALLQRLPEQSQIDSLIIDISQAGLRSGLEFDLIRPGQAEEKEFYVELPIDITVVGSYHEFGDFVSGLAELNRIVSVHNVDISPVGPGGRQLRMVLVAKTYRAKTQTEEEEG